MKNAPIREEKKVITKQAAMRLNDDKLESRIAISGQNRNIIIIKIFFNIIYDL